MVCLCGCAAENFDSGEQDTDTGDEMSLTIDEPERKIINTAEARIITDDPDATVKNIRVYVSGKGWFDKENHSGKAIISNRQNQNGIPLRIHRVPL